MAENSQLSDETKNNSTDTSSTDASSAVIGNHENAVVPHKISNHDKLVQTMVMVDGEWINVNDTNDQANMKEDVHKVNKKVVEAQKGIVEAKNAADSAVKYADSAVSASKVNSDAIAAQSSAISEAKAAADDAASKAQFIKENAASEAAAIRNQVADVANNVSSVKADVASATSDVANLKVDVQANSAAIIKTNDAVKIQSKNSSDAINELKIANGQVESIAKDAKNNATVAKQTADAATIVAQDAKSNAVVAKQTASSATIEATNATSTASKAELSVNGLTTRVDGIEGDTKKLSGRVTSTETILQQTKDQLLQKADKSVVDQANNLISQLSAEQKVMADQISSKVSSEDFKTLDNKVGGAIAQIDKNTTAIDQTNKQISLKADQTEVNQVKQTATQNSSRLNVMSNEIQSKVTSTDVNNIVDSKGYATTSTVQSLITQKAGTINESITNLTNKVNSNNGGGVNLLQGTAKINFPLNSNGGTQTIQKYDDETNYIQHTSNTPIYDMGPWWPWTPEIGQVYTMSADVCGNGYIQGEFYYEGGDEGNLGRVDLTNDWQRISNTFRVNTISGNCVIYANNSTLLKVKHIKIERGSVATPWTPAPSDNATVTQLQSVTASIDGLQSAVKNKVDQSQYTQLAGVVQTKVSQSDFNRLDNQVNVQTLDSADINNMKANGHYFVHNLANNPIGGWVYVDVTGNGNDRIRQDVYQDSGTKHAFRRWFGSYWTGWSTGAEESEITQLRNDINLRVKSGDLLSQINIAAGHTLIQSNKIYFDADSFVMSPNSKAFIPSAYITNINADKITTGTLDAAKFNVKNLSADSITSGTLDGIKFKTEFTNDNGISIMGDRIAWTSMTSFGEQLNGWIENSTQEIDWLSFRDLRLQSANNIAVDTKGTDDVTRWSIADYDYYDQPGLMSSNTHKFIPEEHRYDESADADQSNVILLASANTYVAVRRRTGIVAHLDSKFFNEDSTFSIQKEDKVGFYVGQGENGNQVNVQFAGDGSGFNIHGNFNVYGAKNSAVKTSQGDVAVSAYETAEYYFGDIGEGQTGDSGIAFVGIEKLFSETVNTSIPYQVFITAYGPGNLWVDQREHDRFVVKSDRPNVKFGWEIKAKRRGYENTRLQKVN